MIVADNKQLKSLLEKVKDTYPDFVTGYPKSGIRTMFKPKEGERYYERMREEDLKNGGKA